MKFATSQDVIKYSKLDAISKIKDLGFDGIEFVIPDEIHETGSQGLELKEQYKNPEKDILLSKNGRQKIIQKAEVEDIELVSICLSFLNLRKGLTSADSRERKTTREYLETVIVAAEKLDIQTILIPFLNKSKIKSNKNHVRSELQMLAPRAEQAGVVLALETDLNSSENQQLINEIRSSHVKIYYDVGNAVWFGYDPVEEIQELNDQIAMLHVKDGDSGHSDAMLGTGKVNFEKIGEALSEIEYDKWVVLETIVEKDPLLDTQENLEFLQQKFD